jgi:hypothetical protein
MDNKLSLEKITMLLQAADKIRNAGNLEFREEGGVSVSPDKLSRIRDTMQLISGFLPETHRLSFNNALKSCNLYSNSYCTLKKHLRNLKGQDPDVNHILSTLKVVMPMLENQQTVPLRKAVSIIEVMRE